MKISGLLINIIVYTFVCKINRSFINVFAASSDVPTRDVTSMTPVDLDISDQADSVYFTYSKSPDSQIHTFVAKDGFAIKNISVTDRKTGRSEHLWGSTAAVSNAYKVIAHSSGPTANFIEIHLLNRAVTSVYSTIFSSTREEKTIKESTLVVKEDKAKPVEEKKESPETTTKSTVNYKLLYILLPTILGAVALVIAASVIVVLYRRKRENSANLLFSESAV